MTPTQQDRIVSRAVACEHWLRLADRNLSDPFAAFYVRACRDDAERLAVEAFAIASGEA